jgi:hypothetical protein
MLKEKTLLKPIITIGIFCLFAIVSLSGCINNQNTGNDSSKLIGTWIGEKEISMFGGRSSTISQLSFTKDTAQATLSSDLGDFTMNYTYTIAGNILTLEPTFGDDFPGRQSPNGSRQWNGTQPPENGSWGSRPNGTQPWNGSQPPQNDSWPSRDGSSMQPMGERPSMSITFNYGFNEQYTVLYLEDSQFTKIQ